MNLLLLSGSVGKKSYTRTLLKYLESLLISKGIRTIFWDLGERPLPIAIPEYHMRPKENPVKTVGEFVSEIINADGLVLGSPLYHGSYSGVLKNALDNLPPEAFLNKPIGLVSHSSNARSCVRPSHDLRPIVGSLGGYPTRIQIGTTDEDYTFTDGSLTLTAPSVQRRSEELVTELAGLLNVLKQPKRL